MPLSPTPTYIPLKHAAQKYGVSEKVLLERVKSGSIASGQLLDGEVLVAEHNINSNLDPSLDIKREDFKFLKGQSISMSEASRKYSEDKITIPHQSISRWSKTGHIKVLDRGWRVLLDEADVAYCAAVYKAKYEFYSGRMAGVTIFDEDGNPYRIKHSNVAAYKRSLRRRSKGQKSSE